MFSFNNGPEVYSDGPVRCTGKMGVFSFFFLHVLRAAFAVRILNFIDRVCFSYRGRIQKVNS